VDVTFADNRKAIFGAGSDLQIYHNGNHSFIEDSGTGNLYLRGTNLEIQSTSQEKYLAANANGGVKLYYDNAEKLATTNTGIDVTGTVTADAVGIGTDSPDTLLHLSDAAGGAVIRLERNDTTIASTNVYGEIQFEGQDASAGSAAGIRGKILGVAEGATGEMALAFQTASGYGSSTERLRIDSSGQVGIGTSSPERLFHVNGGTENLVARFESTDTATAIEFKDSTGTVTLETRNDFRFKSGSTINAIIDSSGNVGIGTTPESTWDSGFNALQIGSRGALWSSTGGSGTWFTRNAYYDGTNFKYIATDEASAYEQGADGSHRWSNASSGTADANLTLNERMRIDSSGNVLVGTTLTNPTTGSDEGIALGATGLIMASNANDAALVVNRVSSNGDIVIYKRQGVQVGSVSVSGTNATFNTSSDQRLKDNIVDAPSASDDIDAIQVRSFDWKADSSHQKYGMVAQELQSVAPEAVTGDADSDDMMGVDYSKLVPMLVKEIQSLRARVAQLEGEN
jgi:hypothetical protein